MPVEKECKISYVFLSFYKQMTTTEADLTWIVYYNGVVEEFIVETRILTFYY